MWIEMTKTYAGAEGIFARDCRYDLPESVVNQLPGKCWKKSNPPWEDNIDRKALKLAEARQGYEIAKARAELLAGAANAIRQAADACVKPVVEAQAVAKSAEEKALHAREIAEKKNATDKQKQKAWGLAREHKRAGALFVISTSNLRTLSAQATLKRLEYENAVKEAERLAKELGIETGESRPSETADPAEDNGQPKRPADDSGTGPEVSNEVIEAKDTPE